MNNKTRLEKSLHEILRDLPDAAKAAHYYERGYITFSEALATVLDAITADAIRAAKEGNA